MDHRVVPAQRVDLLGDSSHLGDARQVADNDILGLGQRVTRVRRTRFVARVQRHLMAVPDEKSRRHQAEAVGRTGNENARHRRPL
jgi:hypothetical protein